MFDGSFLTYLSPGLETPLYIIGWVLLALGVGAIIVALVLARRARKSKAAATMYGIKQDAFFWWTQGAYGTVIGGLLVAANFATYNSVSFVVGIVGILGLIAFIVVLGWRYKIAERGGIEARAFDRKVWEFFNGKE